MFRATRDKKIEISRGDTRVIPCRFRCPEKAPEDGTHVVITLKRDYNDNIKIWEKETMVINGKFQFEIRREDTINLKNDVSYFYDIQLRYKDGQQYTLLTPTAFKVLGVVGVAEM